MPDRRRALLCVLVALCTLALPASASGYSVPVERGLGVGQGMFGPAKCGAVGVATQAAPADQPSLRGSVAWADRRGCRIVFNAHPPTRLRTPEARCQVVVHEYGHLAEYRDPTNIADPLHSHDPRSVMYAANEVVEGRIVTHGRARSAASGYVRGCSRRAPVRSAATDG